MSSSFYFSTCTQTWINNIFLKEMIFKGDKLWNNIPNDIRLNSSKCCFKRFLNRNLGKKSYYFNFGSRKEQIIFARLRLKCSSLKDHLFQKNIIDSGLCTWGKIETTAHYLLHCPNIRNETKFMCSLVNSFPHLCLIKSFYSGNVLWHSFKYQSVFIFIFQTVTIY
jgi:hypothetical protein